MKKIQTLFILTLLLIACQNEAVINSSNEIVPDEWTISKQYLNEGTPFALMNTPTFKPVHEINKLTDGSKVALVSFKNQVRVYPYYYTNKYEIINDVFENNYISVSFCPITQSAICFNREINGKVYNLIASGYLFKDNMVPSDENLNFFLSQMLMKGIKGEIANQSLAHFNLIETTWKTVKNYFPNAQVFYDKNTTKSYTYKNNITEQSEFAYGVFNTQKTTESVELFFYPDSTTKATLKIINQRKVFVLRNKEKQFFNAFYIPKNRALRLLDDAHFPNIISDTKGNIYTIFGYAVSGPNAGTQLESPKAYKAQLWAWKDFFPDSKIND